MGEIKTDNDIEEKMGTLEDLYGGGGYEIIDIDKAMVDEDDPVLGETATVLNGLSTQKFQTTSEFIDKQFEQDQEALVRVLRTEQGRAAVEKAYHIDLSQPSIFGYNNVLDNSMINDSSLAGFYSDEDFDDEDGMYNPYKVDHGNLFSSFMGMDE